MLEFIGFFSVVSLVFLLLSIQYTLLILNVIGDGVSKIFRFLSWIPFFPYLVMLIITLTHIIELIIYKIKNG